MKLHNLVDDPTKLKTYSKYVSLDDIIDHVLAGNQDPRLIRIIANNPKLAYEYAYSVNKGKWPIGEKAIASDPEFAYLYARYVIKDRFPKGEPVIAKDLHLHIFMIN